MDLAERLDGLERGETVLVLTGPGNFREVADGLTEELVSRDREGVFITADRVFSEVEEELEYRGVALDGLDIIDLVASDRNIEDADEMTELVASPTAFNDIMIAFKERLEGRDDGFVVLDSFTSWLIYGGLKEVGNFVKKLSDAARERETALFVLAVENQLEEDTVDRLMTFCDRRWDVSGD